MLAMSHTVRANDAADAKRNSARSGRINAFVDGLVSASPLSAAVMVVTMAILLSLPAIIITPGFMRDHGLQFVPDDRNDFDAFSSVRAMQMQNYRGPEPIIVIVGASTTRDALASDHLSAALASNGTRSAQVFKLTGSNQSLWDSIAMLDAIPPGARGVALIGVTPGSFTVNPERLRASASQGRHAFRSHTYDDELQRMGIAPARRYGIYLFDNLKFFLARSHAIARNIMHGGAPSYSERIVGRATSVPPSRWREVGEYLSTRFRSYDDNRHYGEAALERALARLTTSTGIIPVVVEAPVNPRFVTEFNQLALFQRHAERMRNSAAKHGLRVINLNDLVDMQAADFFDWGHLSNEIIVKRCSQAVAAAIADLLSQPES